MIHAFTYYCKSQIVVIATDIWSPFPEGMNWAGIEGLDNTTVVPSLDLYDPENVFRFPNTTDGEKAAHRKVCEIYASQL